MIEQKATISIREAANILGVCKSTAQKAVENGDIPAIKVGGRIVVSREKLMQMLLGESTPSPDADAIAKSLRIMELRAQISNAERELAELTAPKAETIKVFRRRRADGSIR